MFSKILIANRGEIACRIMRTAHSMGIATVAVYSDADANGEHVTMADEAVRIGEAASAASYLLIDRIIDAAKSTGADAIHPGFGFLSENPKFVEAVEAAGLVFIGPGANAISLMGDKITSKGIAVKAGVSVVPGTDDAVGDLDAAAAVAGDIGYPVMVKASAGGGGKGMRVAHDEAELRVNMPQAQNEAAASFGDSRVFIEKYIIDPRHIEIQILADSHGNVIYLGERECSLQRRHQKVFEEAPSPFISDETRRAMGAEAAELARAVGYQSAGTVEFIVGSDQDFYFLEMNTRLQVEHPVTELVYGIDLVEWMIRIAAGEALAITQDDVKPNGWAVEARVYAEDPSRGFLPSIGRLRRYLEPSGDGIRVDSGIAEGGEISMYYDPMIAKLIGYGATRDAAIDKLSYALDGYVIEGLRHNRQFLRHVCDNPDFRRGDMTTGFIGAEYPNGFTPPAPDAENLGAMRALAVLLAADLQYRLNQSADNKTSNPEMAFYLYDGVGDADGSAIFLNGGEIIITIDGEDFTFDHTPHQSGRLFSGSINDRFIQIQYKIDDETISLMQGATCLEVTVLPHRAKAAQAFMPIASSTATDLQIIAPMPGLLAKLLVKEGDAVEAGDDVAVIEAMKMENLLKAESAGVVAKIHATEGDNLMVDQPILTFADGD